MSRDRLPPPPSDCLVRPYPSSQKGGTLIAEEVGDVETHRARLCNPDGYRPSPCPRCADERLHVHDYPERVMLADPEQPVVRIVRYACAGCSAIWRVLPLFLARRIWRSWPVVERAAMPDAEPAQQGRRLPPVPARTMRRWTARLASAALLLTQALATSGAERLRAVVQAAGLDCDRQTLALVHAAHTVASPGQRLASLAALAHRLVPGIRLM